jgi:DNA modification methylase
MNQVVEQCRRVLKPKGSAVFVLQANQSRVGSTRPWLFEFVAKWSREWNLVQDCYWWNHAAMPTVHCQRKHGLLRPSVKHCVWLGPPDSYRNQEEVLWTISESLWARDKEDMALGRRPSGQHVRDGRTKTTAVERGGTTPFNLLPIANTDAQTSAGAHGHGAGTPRAFCDWWVQYLCPVGGVILDPFFGTGSVGVSALSLGRGIIGIEKEPSYCELARERLGS